MAQQPTGPGGQDPDQDEEADETPDQEAAEGPEDQEPGETGGVLASANPKMASSAAGQKLTPEVVLANLKIPPAQMPMFSNIVKAAMTILLAPQMEKSIVGHFQGGQPAGQELAQGVLLVVLTVVREGKGTVPPRLLVPVGVYLCAKFGQFLNKAGAAKLSDQDIAQAMHTFTHDLAVEAQNAQQKSGVLGSAQGAAAAQPPGPPQMPGQPMPPPGAAPAPRLTTPPMAAPGSAPTQQAGGGPARSQIPIPQKV
jgi:hypothetical protein